MTHSDVSPWQGWLPWLIVTAIVILWTTLEIFKIGAQAIPWPGLDKAVSITLYNDKPYAAVWGFQPLATGTAILLSAIITAIVVKMSVGDFFQCVVRTIKQAWIAILTVCLIIGLAYLMNYSGMAYTLGLGVGVGRAFVRHPLALPGLGGGRALGQRHVGQRAVRQPSGGRGEAA